MTPTPDQLADAVGHAARRETGPLEEHMTIDPAKLNEWTRLQELLNSPDIGPLPWLHSETENGEIEVDEPEPGQRHSIGGFWGGCAEWLDRSELVVLLVNNASALLAEVERLKTNFDRQVAGHAMTARMLAEAKSERDALEGERDELRAESHELTKALTGLTCSGSEFFIRKGDRYAADIKSCVDWVRRAREADHNRTVTAIHDRKSAEAQLVALQAQGDALAEAVSKAAAEAVPVGSMLPDFSPWRAVGKALSQWASESGAKP